MKAAENPPRCKGGKWQETDSSISQMRNVPCGIEQLSAHGQAIQLVLCQKRLEDEEIERVKNRYIVKSIQHPSR